MRRLIAVVLSLMVIPVYAQDVAVLCEHDEYKTVTIEGTDYNMPQQEGKVYDGQLVKEHGNAVTIQTDKGLITLQGCTTIDVQ